MSDHIDKVCCEDCASKKTGFNNIPSCRCFPKHTSLGCPCSTPNDLNGHIHIPFGKTDDMTTPISHRVLQHSLTQPRLARLASPQLASVQFSLLHVQFSLLQLSSAQLSSAELCFCSAELASSSAQLSISSARLQLSSASAQLASSSACFISAQLSISSAYISLQLCMQFKSSHRAHSSSVLLRMKPQTSAPARGMPHMLLVTSWATEACKSNQVAALSPPSEL